MYPLNNLYKDISGYLSTPSDEGNYALKVGTGGYAAEISQGIVNAVAAVIGEVTTQYVIRYIPDYGANGRPDKKNFRNIDVKVPSLADVRIRAAEGHQQGLARAGVARRGHDEHSLRDSSAAEGASDDARDDQV